MSELRAVRQEQVVWKCSLARGRTLVLLKGQVLDRPRKPYYLRVGVERGRVFEYRFKLRLDPPFLVQALKGSEAD